MVETKRRLTRRELLLQQQEQEQPKPKPRARSRSIPKPEPEPEPVKPRTRARSKPKPQAQEDKPLILVCKKCGRPLSYTNMNGRTGLCQNCFNVEVGRARRLTGPGERKRERDRIYYMVSKAKGSAKDYKCTDCRKRGAQWSHIHDTDSEDPNNYVPRCYNCHVRYYGRGKWEPMKPRTKASKQRREVFYETG